MVALRFEPRKCHCGKSAGNYRPDGLHADFTSQEEGKARVIGMLNREVIGSISFPIIPFITNYKWFPILADGKNHVHWMDWEGYWVANLDGT